MFYNGELLTETKEEGGLQSRYVLGYGVAASEVHGQAGYHAYHLDEQNSTVYITGNQRQVENAYAYDAFGNLRGQAGELLNRILYTGQQYDQEMGQYYLRARYYNPVLGRFTQEDVYRGDGLNLYAYCQNNPVMYYDPSGYGGEDNCGGKDKTEDVNDTRNGADGTDPRIAQAKEAQQKASDLAEQYGYNDAPPNRKTVASDGDTNTLSGWKDLGDNNDFTRVSPQEVINKSQEIGHDLRSAGANDQGVAGQYNASHAEKQLSIISDNPIGISQPMCTDCQNYFTQLSVAENRTIVTADPNTVRIFNPDSSVSSIKSDGSVSVSVQKNKK